MKFSFRLDSASLAQVEAQMRRDIEETLAQPAVMQAVGDFLTERIRFQARTTKPFNQTKSLPLLRDQTVLHRIYLLKHNKPHPVAEEGLSNLTLTGELLNSLTYQVLGPGTLTVYFGGVHSRYRGAKGQPIGKAVPNADIARYLTDKGFVPFDRSIEESKIVKSRIASIVKRYLRRSLRVRQDLRSLS